jgi:hypothetical protein
MERARLAARWRSAERAVGATFGAGDDSTDQMWCGKSSATRAVSSATTGARPVQFQRICRETLQPQASSLLSHQVPHHAAAMARQTIPDDHQFAGNVAQQMREKLALNRCEACGKAESGHQKISTPGREPVHAALTFIRPLVFVGSRSGLKKVRLTCRFRRASFDVLVEAGLSGPGFCQTSGE